MERPTWDEIFISVAKKIASRSTCCRIHVGCVIAKENRIETMGYNGTPKGQVHCTDYFEAIAKEKNLDFDLYKRTKEFKDLHHEFSTKNEIHAEMNAILFAAKNNINIDGATLYVTYSPCIHCAKSIVAAGIKRVVFAKEYDRDTSGIDFLQENSVICETFNKP